MKTTTAGVLAFAAFAAAQLSPDFDIPECALTCFTSTITDHPPLECKEKDMFGCFCKDPFGPDLQRWWAICVFEQCPTRELADNSILFGKEVCADMGSPITIEVPTPVSTTTGADETSTSAADEETTAADETTTTSAADEESTSAADGTSITSTSLPGVPTTEATTAAAQTSSKPAETTTSGSVSQPQITVTKQVSFTTSVCEDSTKPVVTVTSAHWECPHGCNGTVTSIHKPNPSKPGKPDGHHSEDNAHGTPSQPKPTGTGSGSEPAETTPVIVNMGNSATVSSLLAAAGVAVAVFRLL